VEGKSNLERGKEAVSLFVLVDIRTARVLDPAIGVGLVPQVVVALRVALAWHESIMELVVNFGLVEGERLCVVYPDAMLAEVVSVIPLASLELEG